jgi:hypothetical protein
MNKYTYKIALIGNMNNNHFSILRYLVDLEIDAHLYLFMSEINHFLPDNDTWEIDKYKFRIHNLKCGSPIKDIFSFDFIEFNQFRNYDILIGCGLSPFYLALLGIKLDIFIPYGSDLYDYPFHKFKMDSPKNFLREIFGQMLLRKFQKKGIRLARKIVVFDFSKTYEVAINKLGVNTQKLHIPMVFCENNAFVVLPKAILDKLSRIKNNFVIMQHSRQYWHASIDSANAEDMKHNNLLIQAIGKLVENENHNIRCVFSEYGPDFNRSKELIQKLGLDEYFIWLPKMSRKLLLKIINEYVDIGADQFGGSYFGGTGYEVLACGKPLMNSIKIEPKRYEEITGIDFPPIINVSTPEEMAEAISFYMGTPEALASLAQKSKLWFNKNCGSGLIDAYIELFNEIMTEKKDKSGI